jgi:hypothetical protein
MKKNNIFSAILTMCLVLTGAVSFTACSNDDLDTNQYVTGVGLNVYGPTPVMRGGTLRFLGSNLDQISQVEIPGVAPITNIEVIKAGVPSEIRIVVPHDGPQPGLVKLTAKNGATITTVTELNFTEGLDPANITMTASAMPGETIRLSVPESGDDYLDIIHMVEFAGGVQVGENDFTAHTRYVIELVVPEEAKTGKLNLYTADLTATEVDPTSIDYQIISTEKAIEVGVPSVTKIASPRGEAEAQGSVIAKAGETITVTGNYFNLINEVKVNGVKASEFEATKTSVSFALPEEAADGAVTFITKSEVEIPVGNIITVKPTNCVATPNPVKALKTLQINGDDMDLVVDVEFADASGEYSLTSNENVGNTTQAYAVIVPAKAIEGTLKLVMANGIRIDVPFTLVKPVVTGYDNATVSAGGVLTIQGTDLDLITSVQFGEGTTDVAVLGAVDGKSITLNVPMDAKSGAPTLKLANGTSIEGEQLAINEALFCYATQTPGEEDEVKAGNSMLFVVSNGDKLTGVEINGTPCQWILTGQDKDQLIIGIPDSAGKGSKVRLISSNGEITYTIDIIPNTEVTTVLWTGMADLAGWSWNWQIGDGTLGAGNPKMFVDMDLQEGDIIRLYATAYNEWWQVQFFNGHWEGQNEIGNATGLNNGNNINSGIYNLDEHEGAIEIPVTAALREQLTTLNDWGYCWILQGEGITITKIAVTHYNSLETTVWQGEAVADDWGNQPTLLSDGGTELLEAGLKVGSILRIYLTPTDSSWNCQVWDGHWKGQWAGCDFSSGNWDLSEHNGAIEVPVTQDIYNSITTVEGWGGSFILNGDNVICTKVTIE